MKTKELLKKLGKNYPIKISKKYHDFSGLQCGKIKEETKTIFLCLDFDELVLNYIKENNLLNKIDLIISHHPFIYGKKSEVLKCDLNKKVLYEEMQKLNIPIYSFHTNFDEGKDGMNDALINALELENIKVLETMPMARGGELKEEMDIIEFSKFAKNKLNVDYGLLLPYGIKKVKKIAIIGGGGWHYYKNAMDENYDIFVSGDCPHHGRREIILNKFNYLDLPHEIEKIFMKQFKKVLLNIDSTLTIYTLDHEKLPIVI